MASPLAPGNLKRLAGFARYLFAHAGKQTWPTAFYLVVGSLTEGVSILLMVPLLALLQPGGGALVVPVPQMISETSRIVIGLPVALTVLTLVIAAQALLMRLKTVYMATLVMKVVNEVRLGLFEAIGAARWRFLAGQRQADLQRGLTADIERVQMTMNTVLALCQTIVLLVVYGVVSLIISPIMTVVAMGIGLAFLVLLAPITRRSSAYGAVMTERQTAQFRTIDALLGGLKVVKSLNAEPRYVARMKEDLEDWLGQFRTYLKIATLSGALFQILSAVGVSIFVAVAVMVLEMNIGSMIVMIFLFMRIAPRFNLLQSNIQEVLVNLQGFDEVRKLTDLCRENAEPEQVSAPAPTLSKMLTFRNVRFGYGPDAPILPNLSLAVPAGKITAIIGASGGGKSTIGDLIMGLLEPDEGVIEIDDLPLTGDALRGWRRSVAYVPQDVFLMHESIRENLKIAVPDADDEAMWRALDLAQAGTFVRGLDQQLDTVVGPRGARLSGGERQRIALARALLMKPQLLILDEATSALDWENQTLIAKAIEGLRGQMTIITIAHRASMISFADWVLAIDEGRLVEVGLFSDLSAQPDSTLSRLLQGEGRQA